MPARSTHLLDAIPRFPVPSRTRSARSTGTCRGLPARPTSRKCARWRRSSRGRPFSTAGRPSANRAPLAEIHLRCRSAKGFRTVGTESRKARGSRERRGISRCIESAGQESHERLFICSPRAGGLRSLAESVRDAFSESRSRVNFRHVRIHFPAFIGGGLQPLASGGGRSDSSNSDGAGSLKLETHKARRQSRRSPDAPNSYFPFSVRSYSVTRIGCPAGLQSRSLSQSRGRAFFLAGLRRASVPGSYTPIDRYRWRIITR